MSTINHQETGAAPADISFLHTIRQTDADQSPTIELMRRYSAYKYGSPIEIANFAEELLVAITTECDIEDAPDEWAIVTPPFRFSGLPSSVVKIGETVASELGVEYVRAYTEGPDELKVGRYTGLSSLDQRLADRRKTATKFLTDRGLEDRRVMIIDDIFVTGSTFYNLQDVLGDEAARSTAGFAIARLESDSPTFEEAVNTAIYGDTPRFLQGLNHPDFSPNRRVFKTLYRMPKERFPEIVTALSQTSLAKFIDAATMYVQGDEDRSRLELMQDVLSKRESDTQPLSPEQQNLSDRDIRTLDGLQKMARETADGRMILSGGYVTEALAGGTITRFHQDMDVRIFIPHGTDVDKTMEELMPALAHHGYEGWVLAKRKGDKFKFLGVASGAAHIPRKIEINFETMTETQPDDPNTVRVAGEDGDYEVSLAQATLQDSRGNDIPVDTRSMDAVVARRILRLTGNHVARLRDVKQSDIRDLQRLISSQRYDETQTITYLAGYLQQTSGLSAGAAEQAARAEIAETRDAIARYSLSGT